MSVPPAPAVESRKEHRLTDSLSPSPLLNRAGFEWFAFAWAALYSLPIFAHLTAKDVVATALSTPPFLFPFVLVCLMAPRATNGHKWYKKTFGDKFPRTRKAIVPFVF